MFTRGGVPELDCTSCGPLITIDRLPCAQPSCNRCQKPLECPDGTPLIPDDFAPWFAGDLAPYTECQLDWLEAATEAAEIASELWAHCTCSPWTGICCRTYRRCWPCECRRSCHCGGYTWFEDLPYCGQILDARLTMFDVDGAATDWVLGEELRVDNGRLVAQHPIKGFPPQHIGAPVGDPCTWVLCLAAGSPTEDTVTPDGRLVRGLPRFVARAIADMACSMLDDCYQHDSCGLPANASRAVNDGIVFDLVPMDVETALSGGTDIVSWNRAVSKYECTEEGHSAMFPLSQANPELEWIVTETLPDAEGVCCPPWPA